MNKNNIKLKLQSFVSEAEKSPVGKTETEKVQKQEKTVNNDYYKEVSKKMGEYDSASTNDKDSIKNGDLKKTSSEDTKDVNFNGMDQLQYDNKPSEEFKKRAKEALTGSSRMGNKTYTGAENGNTEEVWGASGGKHTGEELIKQAKLDAKKSAYPQEDAVGYNARPSKKELAYENKEKTNDIVKENKMKRLRFEKPFNGLGKALTLIPESYKVNDKVFEMTDGNESYKIRWEGSLNEGQAIVLVASDKKLMNEDIQHMKHLMGFKSEKTLGTPSAKERVSENSTFRDIMDMTKSILSEGTEEGEKKSLNESAFAGMGFKNESETVSEEEVSESTGIDPDVPEETKIDSNVGDSVENNGRKPTDSGHDTHIMEEEEEVVESEDSMLEGFENPATFTISEGEATENMSAGEDLGTDVGKTAAGDPRGAGHDDHIMEEEDCDDSESLIDEGWRDFLGLEKGEVIQQREEDFNKVLDQAEAKGLRVNREILLKQATENKFRGKLMPVKGMLIYKAGASGLGNMAAGSGSQTAGV